MACRVILFYFTCVVGFSEKEHKTLKYRSIDDSNGLKATNVFKMCAVIIKKTTKTQ